MLYRLVRFLDRLLVKIITNLEFKNLERVPDSGAFIITSNHLGILDPLIAYSILNRDDIIVLAAEYLRNYAFTRFLAKVVNGIFVDRYQADFGVLRQVMERLSAGGVLIIAPEGTRSKTGGLLPGQQGSAYLASKTGVPVLPVGLIGTEDSLLISNLKRLRRTPVIVRVGETFTLPPYPKEDRAAAIQSYTDEIMCQIAVLLPEENRGVYRHHARTRELLGNTSAGD